MGCPFVIAMAATIGIVVRIVVDRTWAGGDRRVIPVKLKITGAARTTGRDRSCGGLFAEGHHDCYRDIYSAINMLKYLVLERVMAFHTPSNRSGRSDLGVLDLAQWSCFPARFPPPGACKCYLASEKQSSSTVDIRKVNARC
jgi:hypothetical protein